MNTIRTVHAGRRHISAHVSTEVSKYFAADDLSERQMEVLKLVAEGCANEIIADMLGISEDTVKSHMRNVLEKLQANDRTHAVIIALKRGYLAS